MLYPLRQAKLNQLRRLYSQVPAIACKGLCHPNCSVIFMTPLEWRNACNASGVVPNASGPACPFLDDDRRCSVYHARPLVCRLYGVVEGLPCPHGCVPEQVLSDEEGSRLLERSKAISGSDRVVCTHSLALIEQLARGEQS